MLIPTGYAIRFPKAGGPAGDHGSVAVNDKDWKSFLKEANIKGRAQIEAVMKTWCKSGPKNLPDSKFRFEKHYEKGGKSVRIDAFKGYQVRLYGTTVQVDGKPMFLVTGTDFAKKKNAVTHEFLDAVGKTALGLINTTNDRQKK